MDSSSKRRWTWTIVTILGASASLVAILTYFGIGPFTNWGEGRVAKLILYRDDGFLGGSMNVTGNVADLNADLKGYGLGDVISSATVEGGTFTLFRDKDFQGPSVTVSAHGGPDDDGKYPKPAWLGDHNDYFSSVRLNSETG